MMDFFALKTEITTDPLTRGYSAMSDAEVAVDMNTAYRSAPGTLEAVFTYMMSTRTHTNQGTDTNASNGTPSTLLGRLIMAAQATSVPADPFGAGDTPLTRTLNSRGLHSAKAFLFMLQAGLVANVDFTNTEQGDILQDLVNGGVMTATNRTDIIAISENANTRAQELGFGEMSEGYVAYARSI